MSNVRVRWSFAAWLVSLACNGPSALAAETQLLSITGIRLQPPNSGSQPGGQYVASFKIETWGVRVLAVCHIPPGWTITAGKNADPDGELSGSAGEGVAFLDAGSLQQLNDFFLVRVDDYHAVDKGDCAKSCTPATFAGNFYIGEYGLDYLPKPQRVLPSNIRLVPASQCPEVRNE